jgi:hypothetical protein
LLKIEPPRLHVAEWVDDVDTLARRRLLDSVATNELPDTDAVLSSRDVPRRAGPQEQS